jgi:6-phosphogluconolactonase
MAKIIVQPDINSLVEFAAYRIANMIHATLQFNEHFCLALAGGSTPRPLYERLAQAPYATQIDWAKVHIFWGDERCVPPDHVDSNYRMAQDAWLSRVAIPDENIHRLHGESEPTQAATEYEQQLRDFFAHANELFDLTLLGMGDDGHTASLFPGTAAIHEKEQWVVAHHVEKLAAWRLTLTPAALNRSANIMFLSAGAGKADTLKQVLEGEYQPDIYPSQIIAPASGETVWVIDKLAGALLTPTE